jgi:hypothetical protein
MGNGSEDWLQTPGTMAKRRLAAVPANHPHGLSRQDKQEKIPDRMMLEYLPSPDLILA